MSAPENTLCTHPLSHHAVHHKHPARPSRKHHTAYYYCCVCVRRVLRLEAHFWRKLVRSTQDMGFSGRSTRHRLAQHSARPECSAIYVLRRGDGAASVARHVLAVIRAPPLADILSTEKESHHTIPARTRNTPLPLSSSWVPALPKVASLP